MSEAKRQRSAANVADAATLTRALVKLNRRLRRVEQRLDELTLPKQKTSKRLRRTQPITLYRDYPIDALTPSGTDRYIRPFNRHRNLPAEFHGVVKDKPVAVRSIMHLFRRKDLDFPSHRIVNTYRAAGYTIIRSNNSYVNANGHTAYPLFVLPLDPTTVENHVDA